MPQTNKESQVKIIAWPEEAAKLKHEFDFEKPCPVEVSFGETPINVMVQTEPGKPLDVNMDMNVSARKPFPVCISLCEPICAKSDYNIGVTIFDRFVAGISIRGETKIMNCKDETPTKPVCVDFTKQKENVEFTSPMFYEDLKFTPLGSQIHTSTIGDPAGVVKLAFPREGVRIDFPGKVGDVRLTVNNYAGRTLDFFVYSNGSLVDQFTEVVENEVKQINISPSGITAIEIKGGDNEASIIEICYLLLR